MGLGFAALSVWIPAQIVDDDSDGSVSAASVSGLLCQFVQSSKQVYRGSVCLCLLLLFFSSRVEGYEVVKEHNDTG